MNCRTVYARLFASLDKSKKGRDFMKNRIFVLKSAKEKRRYLTALLRSSAGGSLNSETMPDEADSEVENADDLEEYPEDLEPI